MFTLIICAGLISKSTSSPQYYVASPEESGYNPWNDYQNRYKPPYEAPSLMPSHHQVQAPASTYYPAAPGPVQPQQQLPPSYYQQLNPISMWGQQQPPTLSPTSVESLLLRPIFVIDSQVFAMYNLIKCWEKQGDLKKCASLIEKCDALFNKNKKKSKKDKDNDSDSDSDESDDNKPKNKPKRKRNKKKRKQSKRKDRDDDEDESKENMDDNDEDNDEEGDEEEEQED